MLSNGKFLSLLSILFSVGMAIQFDAALRRGHRWPWRYEWRSLLLLADGFLHFALVVEFDILMCYALVAIVVAPLLRLRTRWLVLAAAAAGAFHLFMEIRGALTVPGYSSVPEEAAMGDLSGASLADDGGLLPQPTAYLDEIANRLSHFWELRYEAFITAPPCPPSCSSWGLCCGAEGCSRPMNKPSGSAPGWLSRAWAWVRP